MIKFHYKSDDRQAPAYLAKIKSELVEYTGAWNPEVQEIKISKSFGSEAIRYKVEHKKKYLDIIRKINKEIINIPIRYIF